MPAIVEMAPTDQWVKEQRALSATIADIDQRNNQLLAETGITDIREYWQLVDVSKFLNNTGVYAHTPQGLLNYLNREESLSKPDESMVAQQLGNLQSKGLISFGEGGATFEITKEGNNLLKNYAIVWP